jgi:hypothetical protein
MKAIIYAVVAETKEGNKIVCQSENERTAKEVQSCWEGSTIYFLGEKCTDENRLYKFN